MNFRKILVAISVILLFGGCRADTAHSHEQWLTAWLDEPTCALPCWEGITPGVSTQEEAAAALGALPGVAKLAVVGQELRWDFADGQTVSTERMTGKGDGVVYASAEGIVERIVLRPGDNESLMLDELVRAFGKPGEVLFKDCSRKELCFLRLVYPQEGMNLAVTLPVRRADSTVTITAETQIDGVELFVPVAEGHGGVTWQGYGSYNLPDGE